MTETGLKPGNILQHRYAVQELLGRGGMGTVYLARDLRLEGRLWALKESKVIMDYQQFIDEAKLLSALDHPNLPKIIDYYPPNDEGFSYLVMDYIQGETLAEMFTKRGKKLGFEDILHYSIQLCDLLHYLHTQPKPIIYRDIKPSNVMINEHNQVRLIDFGIARSYKEGQALDTVPLGTIGFAAPEQFENKQSDHRTDIYSLGALMYYLLSEGKYVTPSSHNLADIRPDVPAACIHIIETSLAHHVSERFQSALEMKHKLMQFDPYTYELNKHLAPTVLLHPLNPTRKQTSIKNTPIFSTNQIIAITSLSEGAGSSFLTHTLATALTEYNIQPCIMEQPSEYPYFYETARLERNAPHFIDIPYEVSQGNKLRITSQNVADGILWFVPRGKHNYPWTQKELMDYIFMCNSSILLIDMGFERPLWEEVVNKATLLLVVIDALPNQLNRFQDQLLQYQKLKRDGYPIEFVVNHVPELCDRTELEEAIYYKPIAWISQLPQDQVYEASAKGVSVYSLKHSREKLFGEYQSLVIHILPEPILSQQNRRRRSMFSFLKK